MTPLQAGINLLHINHYYMEIVILYHLGERIVYNSGLGNKETVYSVGTPAKTNGKENLFITF